MHKLMKIRGMWNYIWGLWKAFGSGSVVLGIYLDSDQIDENKYQVLIQLLSLVNPLLDMLFVIGFLAVAGAIIAGGLLYSFGDEKMKTQAKGYLSGAIVGGIILMLVQPMIAYFIGDFATWSLFGPPPGGNWVP